MERIREFLSAEELWRTIEAQLPQVASAVAVFFGFYVLLKILQPTLRRVLRGADFDPTLIRLFVDGLLKALILVMGLVTAASQLGVNIAAALAGIGVLGIAVGFAAQETMANMIAGFLIFWDHPFKVGDWVTTQDKSGEVTEITLRTTRILGLDNTVIVIPNKQIIGDLMINHSMSGALRVSVPVGIAYKESVDEARRVILAAVPSVADVLADPPPTVVAKGLGDSSVDLSVRVWVADASNGPPVRDAVVEACKDALDAAGIEIPFPHMQLFVEQVEDRVLDKVGGLLRGSK